MVLPSGGKICNSSREEELQKKMWMVGAGSKATERYAKG